MKFPFRSLSVLPKAVSRSTRKRLTSIASLVAPILAGTGLAWAQEATKAAKTVPLDPASHISEWQAVILGLVQGLTEFIPVSSSGHLNIVHSIMGQPRQLDYDILLSVGTTLALAWYFRSDWKGLLFDKKQARLRNLVLLSCVPAALVGIKLRHLEDHAPFSDPRFNAICMIVAGAVLLWADKVASHKRTMKNLAVGDALIIGTSQAVALVPGISRSGSTITAGLFLGLKREDAARFSFLMSLPVSLGAIVFSLYGLTKPDAIPINASPLSMFLGVAVSAVSGFWAISFLLNFLKKRDVTPFFIWRLVVGVLTLLYFWMHPMQK